MTNKKPDWADMTAARIIREGRIAEGNRDATALEADDYVTSIIQRELKGALLKIGRLEREVESLKGHSHPESHPEWNVLGPGTGRNFGKGPAGFGPLDGDWPLDANGRPVI